MTYERVTAPGIIVGKSAAVSIPQAAFLAQARVYVVDIVDHAYDVGQLVRRNRCSDIDRIENADVFA
ncbi:MAG: hypothetical protein ACREQV_25705, partial [Candidatus Binatia bacterium]